jgi:DNA-binding MarR family transcriptional regulator
MAGVTSSDGPDGGPYDPPARLRELPSWLTGQVARRAQRLIGDALAGEGARRAHFAVLASLADQGAASQAELGRRLWIDRSDLHGIVAELETAGLIRRVRDERDRRRNLVTLTPAGRARLRRLERRVQAAQDELLGPLSASERQQLKRLLERVLGAG